jgi:hypothetical protein
VVAEVESTGRATHPRWSPGTAADPGLVQEVDRPR